MGDRVDVGSNLHRNGEGRYSMLQAAVGYRFRSPPGAVDDGAEVQPRALAGERGRIDVDASMLLLRALQWRGQKVGRRCRAARRAASGRGRGRCWLPRTREPLVGEASLGIATGPTASLQRAGQGRWPEGLHLGTSPALVFRVAL